MTGQPDKPYIPDHDVLRIIGRGAYGEIWLARSLIGSYRAVKVVYRHTFENERAFNREFEGMASFEPISRAHEGFVNILHVGKSEKFFYYIMELADDCVNGQNIDIAHYVPKTLKTELEQRGKLPAAECINIGLRLTDSLKALHSHRLAHRDIKPANIIFVKGTPKLADIGLVAASGQRSFVGTEGYVPPEGPGTPQADLYSLGKVLYEISMGKDRFDFPEITTSLDALPDKGPLLRLNNILLKACASDLNKRYSQAGEMHDDLTSLENGKRKKKRHPGLWVAALILAAFVALGIYLQTNRHPKTPAHIVIKTDPPGAMILLDDQMRKSPAEFQNLKYGKHALRIMLPGFDPVEKEIDINEEKHAETLRLIRSTGSLELSTQPGSAEFELHDGTNIIHRGKTPATLKDLPTGTYTAHVLRDQQERSESIEIKRNEKNVKQIIFASGAAVITSQPDGVEILIDKKSRGVTPLRIELPTGKQNIIARYKNWPEQTAETQIESDREATVNFEFAHGSVKITSAPGGAFVYKDGKEIGHTPLLVENIPPGDISYQLELEGYKSVSVTGTVLPNQQTFLAARLEQKQSPDFTKPWENGLGMKFIPVDGILVSIWETRVQDYNAFCIATGRPFITPGFEQDDTHPIVRISWNDAQAFCKWLTTTERSENRLESTQTYRLPTDLEWSHAAGLENEQGNSPEERDGKIKTDFPWGKNWPPVPGAGNYADISARGQNMPILEKYRDNFPLTSPVGTFTPNAHGLHDLGGNVWEWVADSYKPGAHSNWGVLRGGSWANSNRSELLSCYRNVIDRNERDVIYGFRCVLAPETAE